MKRLKKYDWFLQASQELKAEKEKNIIKLRLRDRHPLSHRESDYIKWLWGEVQKHQVDIINQKKIKADDFDSYKKWKLEQIKELKTEIEEIRFEGLTNSF